MSKTCFIIDGHYHCFRSFYGLPSMKNGAGDPTQVVYGIAKLVDQLRNAGPDYLIFTFDSPGKTFRHDLYSEYKANRDAAPEELVAQLPVVFELLKAQNIPFLAADGYEADDIIATLVHTNSDDINIRIESRDKDLYQLISDSTVLYDVSASKPFSIKELDEKWNIRPDQVKDFLKLIGDSSDNIPGIPSIGPKTATKLLNEFDTIESLMANIDQIKGAKQKKLIENAPNFELSEVLVTLNSSVPLDKTISEYPLQDPKLEAVTNLYTKLEFTSLLKSLPRERKETNLDEVDYILVNTPSKLKSMLKTLKSSGRFAFDIETTGLDPHTEVVMGLSFAVKSSQAWFVPYKGMGGSPLNDEAGFRQLIDILADPAIGKIGQNIKFDHKFLNHHGVAVNGYIFDTMLASYLLHPGGGSAHNLTALAQRLLGFTMMELADIGGLQLDGTLDMGLIQLPDLSNYACEDADITLQLYNTLKKEIENEGLTKLLQETEIPVALILGSMENKGVFLDSSLLNKMSGEIAADITTLTAEIYEIAGEEFNINSPKQLSEILFSEDKLNLPVQKKTKTGYSTAENVLKTLAFLHPLPEKILESRGLTKLKNTYVDVLPGMINSASGRIHPEFHQVVTATGRLSASNPNLQNIPIRTKRGKMVREAFRVPTEDRLLLTADYSQIELRILAHFSNDTNLQTSFREDRDIHIVTAAHLHDIPIEEVTDKMRQDAKAVNFGIVYGQSAYGLSGSTGMPPKDAKMFIEKYFETFPGIKDFIESSIEAATASGEVRTILNRKRSVPELTSRNRNEQQAGRRIAVNTIIQGSAADLIKIAMINISNALTEAGLQASCIMQIHDELVFELAADELEKTCAIVTAGMEEAMTLNVPLKVNIGHGTTWMEIH